MTVGVRFVDEAVTELDDAALWYEDRRHGLGLAFLAALARTIESIERWPRAPALVEDVSEGLEIRRAKVPRFPYFVAYLVTDEAIVGSPSRTNVGALGIGATAPGRDPRDASVRVRCRGTRRVPLRL